MWAGTSQGSQRRAEANKDGRGVYMGKTGVGRGKQGQIGSIIGGQGRTGRGRGGQGLEGEIRGGQGGAKRGRGEQGLTGAIWACRA